MTYTVQDDQVGHTTPAVSVVVREQVLSGTV